MIYTESKPLEEHKSMQYPYLGIYDGSFNEFTGLIVAFTSPGRGCAVVIPWSCQESGHELLITTEWVEDQFKPYEGSVILQNQE